MKTWLSTVLTAGLVSIPAFTIGRWVHGTHGWNGTLILASTIAIVGMIWAYRGK